MSLLQHHHHLPVGLFSDHRLGPQVPPVCFQWAPGASLAVDSSFPYHSHGHISFHFTVLQTSSPAARDSKERIDHTLSLYRCIPFLYSVQYSIPPLWLCWGCRCRCGCLPTCLSVVSPFVCLSVCLPLRSTSLNSLCINSISLNFIPIHSNSLQFLLMVSIIIYTSTIPLSLSYLNRYIPNLYTFVESLFFFFTFFPHKLY